MRALPRIFGVVSVVGYYCRQIPGMAAEVTVNDPSGPPPTYEPTTTTTSPPLYHPSTTTTARHG